MNERVEIDLTVDRGSPEAAAAAEHALSLLSARTAGGDAYARELAEVVEEILGLNETAGAKEAAQRFLILVDALTTLGGVAVTYAAGKIGVERRELLDAVGRAAEDLRARPDSEIDVG